MLKLHGVYLSEDHIQMLSKNIASSNIQFTHSAPEDIKTFRLPKDVDICFIELELTDKEDFKTMKHLRTLMDEDATLVLITSQTQPKMLELSKLFVDECVQTPVELKSFKKVVFLKAKQILEKQKKQTSKKEVSSEKKQKEDTTNPKEVQKKPAVKKKEDTSLQTAEKNSKQLESSLKDKTYDKTKEVTKEPNIDTSNKDNSKELRLNKDNKLSKKKEVYKTQDKKTSEEKTTVQKQKETKKENKEREMIKEVDLSKEQKSVPRITQTEIQQRKKKQDKRTTEEKSVDTSFNDVVLEKHHKKTSEERSDATPFLESASNKRTEAEVLEKETKPEETPHVELDRETVLHVSSDIQGVQNELEQPTSSDESVTSDGMAEEGTSKVVQTAILSDEPNVVNATRDTDADTSSIRGGGQRADDTNNISDKRVKSPHQLHDNVVDDVKSTQRIVVKKEKSIVKPLNASEEDKETSKVVIPTLVPKAQLQEQEQNKKDDTHQKEEELFIPTLKPASELDAEEEKEVEQDSNSDEDNQPDVGSKYQLSEEYLKEVEKQNAEKESDAVGIEVPRLKPTSAAVQPSEENVIDIPKVQPISKEDQKVANQRTVRERKAPTKAKEEKSKEQEVVIPKLQPKASKEPSSDTNKGEAETKSPNRNLKVVDVNDDVGAVKNISMLSSAEGGDNIEVNYKNNDDNLPVEENTSTTKVEKKDNKKSSTSLEEDHVVIEENGEEFIFSFDDDTDDEDDEDDDNKENTNDTAIGKDVSTPKKSKIANFSQLSPNESNNSSQEEKTKVQQNSDNYYLNPNLQELEKKIQEMSQLMRKEQEKKKAEEERIKQLEREKEKKKRELEITHPPTHIEKPRHLERIEKKRSKRMFEKLFKK